jgi:2-oxoglutarate ferredoxin oxidoreductase subunit alpha
MDQHEVIIGIGGAAGDGVASAGNTLALSAARQGLGVYAYNSYQSVIRGGHSWLRMRLSSQKPLNHGDQVDALIALNQDTLDRHLQELIPGWLALYGSDKVEPAATRPREYGSARFRCRTVRMQRTQSCKIRWPSALCG